MIIKPPINLATVDPERPIADAPINRGLVAWWITLPSNFGGSRVVDLRGRYDGTMPAPAVAGVARKPASRANGYGEVEYNPDVTDPGGTGAVQKITLPDLSAEFAAQEATVAFWVRWRLATPETGEKTGLIHLGAQATTDQTNFPYIDGNMYCSVFDSARIAEITGQPAPPNRTAWNHIAFRSAAGTGEYKVYWNGEVWKAGTRNAFFFPTTPWLGKGYTGWYFDGWQDDVRLWNRALSDAEVQDVYRDSLASYPTQLRRRSLYWTTPAAAPGFTISEDWDSVTAPAIPSGWNVDAGLVTSTSQALSSPNSLLLTGGTSSIYFATDASVDPGGGATVDVATYVYFDDVGPSDHVEGGLTFRCSSSTMSDPGTSCYWASLAWNNASGGVIRFSSIASGTPTILGSLTCNPGEVAASTWYRIRVASTGVDAFDVSLVRQSDGYSMNPSGAFQPGAAVAFAATPTAIPSGGYYGVALRASSGSNRVFADDYNVDATPPPPVVLVYPRRPVIARVPFQFYIVD